MAAGADAGSKLENFEDTIIMLRNVPAAAWLDAVVFVSGVLVNVLGDAPTQTWHTIYSLRPLSSYCDDTQTCPGGQHILFF